MTLTDVLSRCSENGLTLTTEGARLFLDGDLSKVTDELAAAIRAHKSELLPLLSGQAAKDSDSNQTAPAPPTETLTTTPATGPDQSEVCIALDGHQTTQAATDDGRLPLPWLEGLARLKAMCAPDDIPPHRWRAIQAAAVMFESNGWALRAHKAGWTTEQVFGVHQSAPTKRFDSMGLLLALADGSDLTGITPDVAHFSGGQRMRREFIFNHKQCLLWELNSKIKKEY